MWTVFFAVDWWVYQPHDGRRQANSEAQQWLIAISHAANSTLTQAERKAAAMAIWRREKGTAAFVIMFSWTFRVSRHVFLSVPFSPLCNSAALPRSPHVFICYASP